MTQREMDIWAWVRDRYRTLDEAGHGRLAGLVRSLPSDVGERRVERVAAVLPEALAAARALEDPWLEVYFRHWGLQSRLTQLAEGEAALPDAIGLLDLAHREQTKDCPQSVCATQDIAIAYANTDGPGYAEDRRAVVEETMARIDPSWQCFTCLVDEYAGALEDEQRFDEAGAYLDRQFEVLEAGGGEVHSQIRWHRARLLLDAGRVPEALAQFDELDGLDDFYATRDRVSRRIDRARALAALGKADEAWDALPDWDEVQPVDYSTWTAAAAVIAETKPEHNVWQLGAACQIALDYLTRVGANRRALDVALRHGQLAVARGAPRTADRALGAARALLPRLHRPVDAPDRIQALADALAALPPLAPLPVPAAELLEYVMSSEDADPERQLEWLQAASHERPDDLDLHVATAGALAALQLTGQAIDFVFADLEAHPAERRLVEAMLGLLSQAKAGDDEFSRLSTIVASHDPFLDHTVRAVWAMARDNWPEGVEQAEAALALRPEDEAAVNVAAGASWKAGHYARATDLWMRSLEAGGGVLEPGEGWNLLAAASAAGEWAVVRDVATRMGMELSGDEGVVEEEWEACVLVFEEDGIERRYGAQRTGPVTARVLQPVQASWPQHAGDWVVFDARPVDPPPADEEERARFWYTYRVVHVLEEGSFGETWLLDGADPGDGGWAALRDGIRDRGWACWNVTGPEYIVTDPSGAPEGLPGLLVHVAAPRATPPGEMHEALTALTSGWRHPLSWLGLATAAGRDVAVHQSIVERYGL